MQIWPAGIGGAITALRQSRRTAWIILAAGLLVSAVVAWQMDRNAERQAALEFDAECNDIHNCIADRIANHARILIAGAALFNASEDVTRDEWRIFNRAQKPEEQLPGIQGIGFALFIPRAELPRHILQIRSEGFPAYTVTPGGDRDGYSAIIYLEPLSGRNLRAFGYDMLAEPVRREAMERARDENAATLSGAVTLVQETDANVQVGTLMYVPVYHKGLPVATVAQRRAAIRGWVYSPYRMNDLLLGILGGPGLKRARKLHLSIFDGPPAAARRLFTATLPASPETPEANARFTRQLPIVFNGRRWTLCFALHSPGWLAMQHLTTWFSLFGGALISLLLFALVRSLQDTRARAQAMADRLTETLSVRELKYRALVKNIHDVIYTLSADGVFTFVSPAWTLLLGHPVAQVVGQPFQAFVHPDDLAVCVTFQRQVMATGQRQEAVEYRVRHMDGSWRWHITSGAPVRDAAGAAVGFEGIARDISERKLAQSEAREQLRQIYHLERVQIMGEIASSLAHEVNQPLAGILSNAQAAQRFLGKTAPDLGQIQEILADIVADGKRAGDVVGSIRAMLRGENSPAESLDINQAVQRVVVLLHPNLTRQDRSIQVAATAGLPRVCAVRTQIEQVLLNLIINAQQAVQESAPAARVIRVSTGLDTAGQVMISVRDHGPGIPVEVLSQLFKPFYTTRANGLGMGLSISRSIVTAHGGRIWAENHPDGGARVSFTLPVEDGR
ncbi:MAG: CHASE domain-containing protein [bacterium]